MAGDPDKARVPTTAPAALRTIPSTLLGGGAWLPAVLALALAGIAGTAWWMTEDSFVAKLGSLPETSQWVAWVVVLSIQTGIFLALAPVAVIEAARAVRRLRPVSVPHVAAVVALIALPLLVHRFFDPSHDIQEVLDERVGLLILVGMVVAVVAAVAVVGVNAEMAAVRPSSSEAFSEYWSLRDRLRVLGSILALIVATAVLSAGAGRNAVVAMESATATAKLAEAETFIGEDELSKERKAGLLAEAATATKAANRFGVDVVWSYGLYYSFVLVLVYLPPYLSLLALGRAIRDAAAKREFPGSPGYETAKKNRDAWDEELQLKVTATETLRAATLVLIPLVSSLGSSLLGGVKVGG